MFGRKKSVVPVVRKKKTKVKLVIALIFLVLLGLAVLCAVLANNKLTEILSKQAELGDDFLMQYNIYSVKLYSAMAMAWAVAMWGFCVLLYKKERFGSFVKKIMFLLAMLCYIAVGCYTVYIYFKVEGFTLEQLVSTQKLITVSTLYLSCFFLMSMVYFALSSNDTQPVKGRKQKEIYNQDMYEMQNNVPMNNDVYIDNNQLEQNELQGQNVNYNGGQNQQCNNDDDSQLPPFLRKKR